MLRRFFLLGAANTSPCCLRRPLFLRPPKGCFLRFCHPDSPSRCDGIGAARTGHTLPLRRKARGFRAIFWRRSAPDDHLMPSIKSQMSGFDPKRIFFVGRQYEYNLAKMCPRKVNILSVFELSIRLRFFGV